MKDVSEDIEENVELAPISSGISSSDDNSVEESTRSATLPLSKSQNVLKLVFMLIFWYGGSAFYPRHLGSIKESIMKISSGSASDYFVYASLTTFNIQLIPALYYVYFRYIDPQPGYEMHSLHFNLAVVAFCNVGNIFTVIFSLFIIGGLKVYLLKMLEPLVICLLHFLIDGKFDLSKLLCSCLAVVGLGLMFPSSKDTNLFGIFLSIISIGCVSLRAVQMKKNTDFYSMSFYGASISGFLSFLALVFAAPVELYSSEVSCSLLYVVILQNTYNLASINTRLVLQDSVKYGLLKSGKRAFVIFTLILFQSKVLTGLEIFGFSMIILGILLQTYSSFGLSRSSSAVFFVAIVFIVWLTQPS